MTSERYDAVVVGSGPNGLVAAASLGARGWRVLVVEQAAAAGGAVRSEALTVPGYVHDPFSAFYGLLHASPVFDELGLDRAVGWAHAEAAAGVAVSPGVGAVIESDAALTAKALDEHAPGDGDAWHDLTGWWQSIGRHFLQTMLAPVGSPRPALRFGRAGKVKGSIATTKLLLEPLEAVVASRFASAAGRGLVACGITHTDLPVDGTGSAPPALILAMLAQTVGMPVPVGGAGRLAEALVGIVEERGGEVRTATPVTKVLLERGRAAGVELAGGERVLARRAVLADTSPVRLCLDLVGESHLPADYLAGIRRFRYGTGIFKVDLALDGPVPWAEPALARSAVVHVTGDLDTMARSAFESRRGLLPAHPLLVVGQQSVADPSRAPAGGHTLWIETHVPSSPRGDGAGSLVAGPWSTVSAPFLDRVLNLLEQHAPGVGARVVASSVLTPPALEDANPNLVGGDLGGGSSALDQQLIFRPVPGLWGYRTPVKGLYLCSASAHPGGGVHGMVGRNCARAVVRDHRRRRI